MYAVRLNTDTCSFIVPCEVLDEDRVVGSRGANPQDRVLVRSPDGLVEGWVLRSDLCGADGELIDWGSL